jgi:transposase
MPASWPDARLTLTGQRLIVTPGTLLRWYRDIIRRRWARRSRQGRSGCPATHRKVRSAVLRLARENESWGYRRIHGELAGLGITVAPSTIWQILKTAGIDPAPRRDGPGWPQFLRSQAQGILALDFCTADLLNGTKVYVLAAIEHGDRQIRILGTTEHPVQSWVVQEEQQLAERAGTWTVVATMWPAPGAEPIVTDGVVAERTMIGLYLQETMRPAPSGTGPDFRRIDYLHYDRVEGRWKYVSTDTRLPVSIMPARSFGPARDRTLRLQFEPLGFVGFGDEVGGTLMQSDMRITAQSPGRELKQQHFIVADATAREWLAVQYEYRR